MYQPLTHKLVPTNVRVGGGCSVDEDAAGTHLLTFQGERRVSEHALSIKDSKRSSPAARLHGRDTNVGFELLECKESECKD